jgi:hypothetical protein
MFIKAGDIAAICKLGNFYESEPKERMARKLKGLNLGLTGHKTQYDG